MPDLWMDVDVALAEVPVNLMPLTDDTDMKSREVAIVYNQAGMDLVWNFVTPAGAYTQTAVTPTTAGTYDWAHQGDGMYSIEIPASSGASINNDTEGYGWFTGFCTGVLPWRGPVIGFRAAGLNDLLVESAYSTTRGLAGTALPAAAAGAAGGLLTCTSANVLPTDSIAAASIATDAITAAKIADNAIDAGAIASSAITSAKIATGAITSGTFAAGAINAAAIAADAITDAKVASDVTIASVTGAVGSIGTGGITSTSFATAAITAASIASDAITDAKVASDVTIASVTGSVGSVVSAPGDSTGVTTLLLRLTSTRAGYLDNLSAGAVATATNLATVAGYLDTEMAAALAILVKLDTSIELDGAVYRFTTNALEQAPSGTGASAASIRAEIDANSTQLIAIKAKTDTIPASPAAVSDIPTANQNADALLARNEAGGSSTGRTVGQAIARLRNKIVVSGGVMTVYASDDVTPLWTAAITTTAGDPVSGVDPT